MRKLLFIFITFIFLAACGDVNTTGTEVDGSENNAETEEVNEDATDENVTEPKDSSSEESITDVEDDDQVLVELSEEELEEIDRKLDILENLLSKIDNGEAFDAGSYIPGDIPEGEYAFVSFDEGGQYYAEKELNGDIIDNENFDSFGYVYVHGVGNIETRGMLINIEDLDDIGVSGAKEIYEVLHEVDDYKDAGWYKVGTDIDPGQYVIESIGDGYVAVMSGPVGKSDIVNNENIDGRFSVDVQEGQYLKLSRSTITE